MVEISQSNQSSSGFSNLRINLGVKNLVNKALCVISEQQYINLVLILINTDFLCLDIIQVYLILVLKIIYLVNFLSDILNLNKEINLMEYKSLWISKKLLKYLEHLNGKMQWIKKCRSSMTTMFQISLNYVNLPNFLEIDRCI